MRPAEAPVVPGYEFQACLGGGGSGRVYRVRGEDSDDVQALKESHPSPRHGAEDIAFKQEYHLHSRLRHPHIIRSHRFGEIDDQRRFYTMDYVENVGLDAVYRLHGIRGLGEVALAVCSALEYAHAQGTLHGDLKPANILVSLAAGGAIDRVLLADFGQARPIGLESQGEIHGTFAYLAPEELSGWRTDCRSDLYSLGVSLFQAVTGTLPHTADSPRELLRALAEQPVPPLREAAPDLEADWAGFLDSLIARNPAERPRSATDAAERLTELLGRPHPRSPDGGDRLALGGATLHLVGREAEIERITQALRDPGLPRTVIVTGEEGIGKSRLVEEVARAAELDGRRVFRADAGGDAPSGFRVLRGIRLQGDLLDLTGGETSARGAPTLHAQQAELERLVDSLLAEQEDGGAGVFLFDSVEQADLDSVAFLKALQRRLEGSDSLLLLASRDDDPARATVRELLDGALEIRLAPWDPPEIGRFLLAALGGGAGAPVRPAALDDVEAGHLADWLGGTVGGNPRRIESALRSLRESGHLSRRGAGWSIDVAALERTPVPVNARERGREKLRLLSPDARAYLELAAACGPELDAAWLAAAEDFDADVASSFLNEARLHGILARVPGRETRYRFLDPEAAAGIHATIDGETRRGIHLRLADLLDRAGTAAEPGRLARHLERAGERERARDEYVRSARENGGRGAFREAARCFRAAWDLHAPGERAGFPDLVPEWLRTLYTNGQFEDAVRVADEALAASPTPREDSERVAKILLWKAICLGQAGNRDEAQDILRPLLDDGRLTDPKLQALALTEFGIFEGQSNRHESAREFLVRARDVASRAQLPRELGRAELQLGVLCWREDDPAKALEWHGQAQEHLTSAGVEDLLPSVWGNQAICHWYLLDARQAAASHRRAADGYLRQHRRAEAARSYQNLAHVLTEMGRWVEADRALSAAEQLNRTVRGPRQASYFEFARANLALGRGRIEEAVAHAERALELAARVGDDLVTVGHRCLRAAIELEAGRPDECARIAEPTLELARRIDSRYGIARSLYLLGQASRGSGRPNQALQYLDDARMLAEDANQPVVRFRVQLARAELLAERGDRVAAERALAECRDLQERCESELWKGLVFLSEGRVRASAEEHDPAGRSLAAAYETFANLGAERLRAETLVHQSRSLLALGNRPAARAAIRHARSVYQSLGLPPPASPLPAEPDARGGTLHTVRRILETAASVSRDITMLQSVDEVLERILDVAIRYLGTERGVVALADPDTGHLEVRAARNIDRESIADSLEISRSTLASVGREGEMIHTGDALADPRLSVHESIRRGRIRSLISLPIRWGPEMLGALYMDHRTLTDLFGREERLFLRFIADMAAIGIRNARQFEIKEEAVRNLRGELEDDELIFPGTVVGRGATTRELIRRGIRAARAGKVILLTGASGVGKDHLARILHDGSGVTGEFVDCPLPNLPETLMEGELFGVAPGAATHVESREGLVQAAQGGTLFLNEIGDLPLALQPKLLHFLERREFRKVGSSGVLSLDGLIVCATNADLERKVTEGTFRADLFYRLSECVLEVPALRARVEDIPDLADHFLREIERRTGRSRPVLHPLALDLLMRCPWDGNIRELRACLSRAADEAAGGLIEARHLDGPSLRRMDRDRIGGGDGSVREEVQVVEIRRIQDAMGRTGGIITRAASLLGLTESALRRRIDRYHLENLVTQPKRRRPARTTRR